MFSLWRLPGFQVSLLSAQSHRGSVTSERLSWKCDLLEAQLDKATKGGRMLKKILNKKKEETDSSSDSEDDTVPHVGKKEKKSRV